MVSRRFYKEAEQRIMQYFGSEMIAVLEPPSEVMVNRNLSQMVTYVIQSWEIHEKDSVVCNYEEYYNFISDKPYINLIFKDDYEKYITLRRLVNISETEIDFLDNQVQQTLFKGEIIDIPTFGLYSLPQLLGKFSIKNIGDVLRLYGIVSAYI